MATLRIPIRTLTSLENCWRTPPALRAVEPERVDRRARRAAAEQVLEIRAVAVARVDEILRSQQVTGGSLDAHHASIADRVHSNVR